MADNTNISDYGKDPYAGFNFLVEIDGMDGVKARFSEVAGLKGEVEEYEIKEGGLNYRTHILPGRTKWGPVTLKKGLADDTDLVDWWKETVQNSTTGYDASKRTEARGNRKNVMISLLDRDMATIFSWNLRNAWIKSWEGASLNSNGSDMAIETFVLNHEGVTEWTGES
jgi:phage tail-like protein